MQARKLGNTLWDALKAVRPRGVLAVDGEGKEHKINIPDNVGRNRHQHVMQALDGIDWQHVDLLDGKGGLLKRHHRTVDDREPAGELEDIVRSRELSQMAGLLSLMLKAQETALSRHTQGQAQLLEAHHKMLEAATRRLEAAEQRLTHEIDTNYQLSHELLVRQLQSAVGSGEGDGEGDETMAGQALAQVLPQVLQQFLRGAAKDPEVAKPKGKPATKPNGHAAASSERRSPAPAGERDRAGE
jgi:hypothetical protein